MLYHKISDGVLARAFGFDSIHDVHKYVRLDCWGEGSCFFHSLCLLLVVRNRVHGNMVEYTLSTPNRAYQRFVVERKEPFCESFRQVGIALRKRLSNELQKHPALWDSFKKHNHVNMSRTGKTQTLDGVVKELSNPSVWADIWTIRYCAWRLQVNVLFVNPSNEQEPIYCGVENFNHGNHVLFIYWSNHSHFEPIVFVEDNQVVRSFGENHDLVKRLKDQYKKGCPNDPIET